MADSWAGGREGMTVSKRIIDEFLSEEAMRQRQRMFDLARPALDLALQNQHLFDLALQNTHIYDLAHQFQVSEAARLADISRSVLENSAMQQAMQQFSQVDRLAPYREHLLALDVYKESLAGRAMVDLAETARRQWATWEQLTRPFESVVATIKAVEVAQSQRVMQEALRAFSAPALSAFAPRLPELTSLAESIRTPWIDAARVGQSFEALAGLTTIGRAISHRPFEQDSSRALRSLLGDWTEVRSRPRVPRRPAARVELYRQLGMDARLVDVPDDAFDEVLAVTGIVVPEMFTPAIEVVETPEGEDTEVKRRMLAAYDLLFSLETALRDYVQKIMSDRYGANWETQRVPGAVLNAWREKRRAGQDRGEGTYPLVAYADFSDYLPIIIRKDNWNEVFSQVFQNQPDLQVAFQRLQPLRIATMHARPITKADLLLITSEVHRIFEAIGYLNSRQA